MESSFYDMPLQYGALGLCAVLVAVLSWLIVAVIHTQRRLVDVIADNSKVITANTKALEHHQIEMKEETGDIKMKLDRLSEKLHSGHCLREGLRNA